MARMFGTDGVRGVANTELTCDMAFKLGQASEKVLTGAVHKAKILVAKDTRWRVQCSQASALPAQRRQCSE